MLLRLLVAAIWVVLSSELSAQASRSIRVVLEPRHSIGEESGGDAEFARIEAVARDQQSGVLYILDSRLNEIRAFSATGTFVGLGGRPGQGPGELGVTGSLAVDPRGRIHVLDMSNMRITIFGRIDPAKKSTSVSERAEASAVWSKDVLVRQRVRPYRTYERLSSSRRRTSRSIAIIRRAVPSPRGAPKSIYESGFGPRIYLV